MNMFIFFMLVVIFIYLLNIEIRNLYSGCGASVTAIVLQIILLILYAVQLYRRLMYYLRLKKFK
ncbi:hypothetical protein [Clostridioides difficile]|nr:hypothetical protein [Clostridioides difficile]MDV9804320.1 hypothetical protein [Clostridioides difficile]